MAKIFISYKSETPLDSKLAREFHDFFKRAGFKPFVADIDIRIGQKWDKRIDEELRDAEYFLLLMSENSITSDMVIEEVRRAREISKQNQKPLILPIRIKLPKHIPISYDLAGYLNKIQVRHWENEPDTQIILNEIVSIINHDPQPVTSEQPKPDPTLKSPLPVPPDPKLSEKDQLRQHLSGFLVPPNLDQVTEMLYYYISSAPHVLNMIEQLSNYYNSNAGRKVAFELKNYLNNPADLFPETQYGVFGKMDDAWLIHNVAYTMVQANIATPQYFGVDWNALVAANQIVMTYLPQTVTVQLNAIMMNLLNIIQQEIGSNFQAMFTQNAYNQYQPDMGNGNAVGYNQNNFTQQLANELINLFK